MPWLRHLPNLLTLLRMASTPLLYMLLAAGQAERALVLLLLAGASDALDGFLARRYGWQSRLGGLLDPLADKLLLNACFLGLWMVGLLPGLFLLLVLGRDLVIVAGAIAYQLLVRPLEPAPSLSGKINTALQVVFAALLVLQLAYDPWPSQWVDIAVWIVGGVTVASGLDYVLRWSRRAWHEHASDRRDRPRP